jgi:uncharacterized protein (UPF0548 family)
MNLNRRVAVLAGRLGRLAVRAHAFLAVNRFAAQTSVVPDRVFFVSVPSDDQIRDLLRRLGDKPCTYADVGITKHDLKVAPRGFQLDRYGTELGQGREVFARASAVLARIGNYPQSFTRIVREHGELTTGHQFATVATHLGFASVHPCRVLYVVRDDHRFGFGFGTLPGHVESGEERFMVRIDGQRVSYEVQAFSRPDGVLARLGARIARQYQLRFQRETLQMMRSACSADPIRPSEPIL